MAIAYVVTEMFALNGVRYPRGALITDPALIAKVETGFPRHIVRRTVPDQKPVRATATATATATQTETPERA